MKVTWEVRSGIIYGTKGRFVKGVLCFSFLVLVKVFSICDGSFYFRFGVCNLHRSILAGVITICYSIY